MFLTTLKSVIKAGYLSFKRNGWLSTATVMVMTMALFVLGILIFLGALTTTALDVLESKVDISVYFVSDASEENIFSVKREIEVLPDVSAVSYISKDGALEIFRERHRGSALIIEALDELGENPLEASLNIQARDPSNYSAISTFLLEKNYPAVDKINYFENQVVIDRLAAIFGTVRGGGAVLALMLAFIAVLVAFNTIRLAIYTMREEVGIMRFVGAAAWFIRGPFIVNGILYGTIAAAVTTLIFFPLAWLASPRLLLVLPSFDLFHYFLANILQFFAIMLVAGIGLGVLSSMISIRRYLRV